MANSWAQSAGKYYKILLYYIMKLCAPALLYLILSILGLFYVSQMISGALILVKILFVCLWTWFLNFLCSKGYSSVSWGLVLLPFVLLFLIILLAIEVVKKGPDIMVLY